MHLDGSDQGDCPKEGVHSRQTQTRDLQVRLPFARDARDHLVYTGLGELKRNEFEGYASMASPTVTTLILTWDETMQLSFDFLTALPTSSDPAKLPFHVDYIPVGLSHALPMRVCARGTITHSLDLLTCMQYAGCLSAYCQPMTRQTGLRAIHGIDPTGSRGGGS